VAKRPGHEVEHLFPFSSQAEIELNDTSSPHINGGFLKGYMFLITKKKRGCVWEGGGG